MCVEIAVMWMLVETALLAVKEGEGKNKSNNGSFVERASSKVFMCRVCMPYPTLHLRVLLRPFARSCPRKDALFHSMNLLLGSQNGNALSILHYD